MWGWYYFSFGILTKKLRSTSSPKKAYLKCLKTYYLPCSNSCSSFKLFITSTSYSVLISYVSSAKSCFRFGPGCNDCFFLDTFCSLSDTKLLSCMEVVEHWYIVGKPKNFVKLLDTSNATIWSLQLISPVYRKRISIWISFLVKSGHRISIFEFSMSTLLTISHKNFVW